MNDGSSSAILSCVGRTIMLQSGKWVGRADLDGQGGNDGLCVHYAGVAKVVEAVALEDGRSRLEPVLKHAIEYHYYSAHGDDQASQTRTWGVAHSILYRRPAASEAPI